MQDHIIKNYTREKYFEAFRSNNQMVRKQKQGNKKQRNIKKKNETKKDQSKNQNQIQERQRIIEITSSYSYSLQQGHITENSLEKLKKQIKSSDQMVLKNYSDTLSLSLLQIIMTLYNGVEPAQILEFLNFEYSRFLEILQLMMMDDQMPIVSTDFNMINQSCRLANQQISRSISYGLKKLRLRREITDLNVPLYLQENDLRCLLISKLLLIGVGEINQKIKSKQKDENQQHYFHRIVTYLLEKNELLSPKIFYMIEKNWHKIMKIIFDQIEEDMKEKITSKSQNVHISERSPTLPQLTFEQRKRLNQQKQKSTADKEQKKSQPTFQYHPMQYEDSQRIDFPDNDHFNPRLRDQPYNLLESDKKKDRQTQRERNDRIFGTAKRKKEDEKMQEKYQKETIKPYEKKIFQNRQYENYQAKYKAGKHYNYKKVNTKDRTVKKKQKKIAKQKLDGKKTQQKKGSKQSKKEQKKQVINQARILKSQSCQYKPEKKNQTFDDFFLPQEEGYMEMYGRGPLHIQTLNEDQFYEEFDEESFENGRIGTEDMQQSARGHMESEFQRMQVESQTSSMTTGDYQNNQPQQQQQQRQRNIVNPNRAVRHNNREIDHLVDIVLGNRESAIEAIASSLYFQLIVWNVRLRRPSQEALEKDSCCKKLF